jgi:cytochrome b involved in lipid metabolism
MARTISAEEVAKHNAPNDCMLLVLLFFVSSNAYCAGWIIVAYKVYDVTPFLEDHPGGKKILLKVGGMDATKEFQKFHNDSVLATIAPKYCINTNSSFRSLKHFMTIFIYW